MSDQWKMAEEELVEGLIDWYMFLGFDWEDAEELAEDAVSYEMIETRLQARASAYADSL